MESTHLNLLDRFARRHHLLALAATILLTILTVLLLLAAGQGPAVLYQEF